MKSKLYEVLFYIICLIVITLFYLTIIITSFVTALIFGLITTVAFGVSVYLSKKNKYLAILPSVVFFSSMGGYIAFVTKDIKNLLVFGMLGIVLWGLEYVLDRISKKNKYLSLLLKVIVFLAVVVGIAFVTKDIAKFFELGIIGIVYTLFSRPKTKKNDYPIPPLDRI